MEESCLHYTVKPVLSGHSKINKINVLKTDYRLMQVKSIAESLSVSCRYIVSFLLILFQLFFILCSLAVTVIVCFLFDLILYVPSTIFQL